MSPFWQQTIVTLVIAGCVAHLAWRGWRMMVGRGKSGCGSCGSCAKTEAVQGAPVVSLDSLRSSADRR